MRCVLGFDGGGTKTDCVLMDEVGAVLARARSGPSNPLNAGTDASISALLEAASLALRSAGKSEAEIAKICAGIAGAGEPNVRLLLQEGLQSKFPNAAIIVTTDLVISLAATGESPSVVVIAGTGSAALGKAPPLRLARAGGFGPIIGDPGSAHDVGRRAVAIGLQEYLRKQETHLANEIARSLQCKWGDVLDRVRSQPSVVLPSIFPVVAKAADEGDQTAQNLLVAAAQDLRSLAFDVIEQLNLQEASFFLARTGGVFTGSAFLTRHFDALIGTHAPQARIGPLPRSIAEAAALTARSCLQAPLDLVEG